MKRRILIIEPDGLLGSLYGGALEDGGHAVAYAKTAQQAIAAADETVPDLVVLELQMARHNGIEFLYEFKSYTEWQGVPVIVLSTLSPRELAQYGAILEQLQVAEVLKKSETTANLLARVVDRVLGKKLS